MAKRPTGANRPAEGANDVPDNAELRELMARFDAIDADIAALKEDRKELMGEAKGRGFDPATINAVQRIKRQDAKKIAEKQALLELYFEALDMKNPFA